MEFHRAEENQEMREILFRANRCNQLWNTQHYLDPVNFAKGVSTNYQLIDSNSKIIVPGDHIPSWIQYLTLYNDWGVFFGNDFKNLDEQTIYRLVFVMSHCSLKKLKLFYSALTATLQQHVLEVFRLTFLSERLVMFDVAEQVMVSLLKDYLQSKHNELKRCDRTCSRFVEEINFWNNYLQ